MRGSAAVDSGRKAVFNTLSRSDAGDVGGEEVDAVSVEVAAGSVVVLSGAGVSVPGQDLGVAQRHPGIEGVGDRGVPQRVGLMCRGMPAALAIRATMR